MTNQSNDHDTLLNEADIAEAPQRDLWSGIRLGIQYEQALEDARRREQKLRRRFHITSAALAASVLFGITLISVFDIQKRKDNGANITLSQVGSLEQTDQFEIEALNNDSRLRRYDGFKDLNLFTDKSRIYIQYENENMDKKIIASGVLGLIAGSSTTAFILDSEAAEDIAGNLPSSVGIEQTAPASVNTCITESNVSKSMCQLHIDYAVAALEKDLKVLSAQASAEANKNTPDASLSKSTSSTSSDDAPVADLTLEQRLENYNNSDIHAARRYDAHVPPGFEAMTKPRKLPEGAKLNERLINALEGSLERNAEYYDKLEAFYDQSSDLRNTDRELETQDFQFTLGDSGVVLDQVDCIGNQCLIYGHAPEMWQVQKFLAEYRASLEGIRVRNSRVRGPGADGGDAMFIATLEYPDAK